MSQEVFESFHKVRSFECDFYGHVNNATYLNYLEFARMEVLEKKGLTLIKMKTMGFMVVLRKVEITYKFPALMNDWLVIFTKLKEYKNATGVFYQQVIHKSEERVLAEANVTWVTINLDGKPIPFPNIIRKAFGMPMRGSNR